MFWRKYVKFDSKIELNNGNNSVKYKTEKTGYVLPFGLVICLLTSFITFDNLYVQKILLQNSTTNYSQSNDYTNEKLNYVNDNEKIIKYNSLQEIMQNEIYSQFIPKKYIEGYKYEEGALVQNGNVQSLYFSYIKNYGYITVSIQKIENVNNYNERIVAFNEFDKYDITKYEIPFAKTIPLELRNTMECPIFISLQISEKMLEKRVVKLQEIKESEKQTMRFGVSCGEFLVEYNIAYYDNDNLSKKTYDMLMSMPYFENL